MSMARPVLAGVKAIIFSLAGSPKRFPVSFLVLSVGTRCNLDCKDCGNFIPFVPPKTYGADDLVADLNALLQVISLSDFLQIQGGEALLHRELSRILCAASHFDVPRVVLVSNGAALLSDPVVAACRENDISIRVSNYDLRENTTKRLVAQCEEAGIEVQTHNFTRSDNQWIQLGGIDRPADDDDHVVETRFAKCPFNTCLTLEDGLLARCSRAPLAHVAGQLPLNPSDFVDVRSMRQSGNMRSLRNAVHRYLGRSRFMECCRFCNGGDGRAIRAAIQLDRVLISRPG